MDRQAIELLLNPRKAGKPANATIRNAEGKLERVYLKPSEMGGYEGKLGQVRQELRHRPGKLHSVALL